MDTDDVLIRIVQHLEKPDSSPVVELTAEENAALCERYPTNGTSGTFDTPRIKQAGKTVQVV